MARTSYLTIDPGVEQEYFNSIQSGDRFKYTRVYAKNTLLSIAKQKKVAARSLLPIFKTHWQGLSSGEKLAWKNASPFVKKNGWAGFVAEMSARSKAGFSGVPMPSSYRNGLCGVLSIENPATALKIIQPHPASYYVSKKVSGTKGQYSPIAVNEPFFCPLEISLSYKSCLTAVGDGAFAKFYAVVEYLYQGLHKFTNLEVSLDYSGGWKYASAVLPAVTSSAVAYTLVFELFNVQGTLYFDHPKAIHGGVNWVRDPYCKKIDQSFTHAFYQVPAHWVAEILPTGAAFFSDYPND